MLTAHTKAELTALPKPHPLLGFSSAAHAINAHKLLTGPFLFALITYKQNYGQPGDKHDAYYRARIVASVSLIRFVALTVIVYTVLHTIYGHLWLIKHLCFRDKNWDAPASFVPVFLFVALYWVGPTIMITYRNDTVLPAWELVTALSFYIYGIFLHFVSDCQKFFTLTYRGRGLITSGLYSIVRNPNYLGEIFIYVAYCLLTRSVTAWVILSLMVVTIFVTNMRKKDKSLEKYGEDWTRYRAKTWLVLPGIL